MFVGTKDSRSKRKKNVRSSRKHNTFNLIADFSSHYISTGDVCVLVFVWSRIYWKHNNLVLLHDGNDAKKAPGSVLCNLSDYS